MMLLTRPKDAKTNIPCQWNSSTWQEASRAKLMNPLPLLRRVHIHQLWDKQKRQLQKGGVINSRQSFTHLERWETSSCQMNGIKSSHFVIFTMSRNFSRVTSGAFETSGYCTDAPTALGNGSEKRHRPSMKSQGDVPFPLSLYISDD